MLSPQAAPLWAWSPKSRTKHKSDGQPAAVGSPVHTNDTVSTGAKGRLQVTFRDQTNLTLGENATVVIDRYVFDPDASVGEAALNTTKGAFRLATGRLSQMTKKNITVSSPFAAMAVRGTDFWWGSVQGQYGVLLVHNSRLEVRKEDCTEGTDDDRRRCRCAVILDQAEEGTYIDRSHRVSRAATPLDRWRDRRGAVTNQLLLSLRPHTCPAGRCGIGRSTRRFCGFNQR